MGENKKINPGRLISEMQWIKPVYIKSTTGFVKKEWHPNGSFLCDIISEEVLGRTIDYEQLNETKIVFVARRHDVTSEWKVKHCGVDYDIRSIRILEKGMYAEYTISST